MSKTVLLIEDDRDDALLMGHAWVKADLPVPIHVASDGEEAINYLDGRGSFADRATHPQACLVLLDLHLPRKSGFDVLHWIRGQSKLASLPVAVLSASRQRADVDKAYALGASSYLVKPSTLGELVEMMEDFRRYWFKWNIFVEDRTNGSRSTAHGLQFK